MTVRHPPFIKPEDRCQASAQFTRAPRATQCRCSVQFVIGGHRLCLSHAKVYALHLMIEAGTAEVLKAAPQVGAVVIMPGSISAQ